MTFKDLIRSKDLNSSSLYELEKWFDQTYIQRRLKPVEISHDKIMVPGKMYSFKYFVDPKQRFNDIHPVFMMIYAKIIGTQAFAYGINLNLMPPKSRVIVLGKLYDFFYNKGIAQSAENMINGRDAVKLKMDYYLVKRLLVKTGFELAISAFRTGKIIEQPQIITYGDWWKVCFLTPKYINGVNLSTLYQQYDLTKMSAKAAQDAADRLAE